MKHVPSPYEERRALLARMQESRTTYRRLLTQSDRPHSDSELPVPGTQAKDFPRSMTVRWIMRHPYVSALAATALVFLGPGRAVRTIVSRGNAIASTALRAQAHVTTAAKVAAMVAGFIQRRRARHSHL